MAVRNGGGLAASIVRSWCDRHANDEDHQPSERAIRAAHKTLLVHSFSDAALEHIARTGLLQPAPHRADAKLFFFAGPARRALRGLAGAMLVRPAGELALAREADSPPEAQPYDTGGLPRYSGLTATERVECLQRLAMPVPDYRNYLAILLHCGFVDLADYLDDGVSPITPDSEAASDVRVGLWKAFRTRDRKGRPDPAGWTVEVAIPKRDGFPLNSLANSDQIAAALLSDPSHLGAIGMFTTLFGSSRVCILRRPIPLSQGEHAIARRMRSPIHDQVGRWTAELQRAAWGA